MIFFSFPISEFFVNFLGGVSMASIPKGVAPPVSLRHGVSCVPVQGVTVENVLVAIGEKVRY